MRPDSNQNSDPLPTWIVIQCEDKVHCKNCISGYHGLKMSRNDELGEMNMFAVLRRKERVWAKLEADERRSNPRVDVEANLSLSPSVSAL